MPLLSFTLILFALIPSLSACRSEPAPPPPETRPLDLAERVLAWVTRLDGADEQTRADAALALGEVAMPVHAPRLRLLVAGDDETVARGAAIALVRILHLREPSPEALDRCVREETNDLVRAECDRHRGPPPASIDPDPLRNALSSGDPVRQRAALRALLRDPGIPPPSLDAPLVHALRSNVAAVRHLAEAVLLRRSLADAPPSPDAAMRRTP